MIKSAIFIKIAIKKLNFENQVLKGKKYKLAQEKRVKQIFPKK